MMWRGLCIATLLVMSGPSARAVGQAMAAGTAAGIDADANTKTSNGAAAGDNGKKDSHGGKKAPRRCIRRSRLGICERWDMPKSPSRTARPDAGSDARNPPAKH